MKLIRVALAAGLITGATVTYLWLVGIAAWLVSSRSDASGAEGWCLVAVLVGIAAAVAAAALPRLRALTPARHGTDAVSRTTIRSLLVLVIAFSMIGCGYKRVPPGYVGIKVDLYGKDKGVEGMPLVTGAFWYNPLTTSILEYPTFVQTAIWATLFAALPKDPDKVRRLGLAWNKMMAMQLEIFLKQIVPHWPKWDE